MFFYFGSAEDITLTRHCLQIACNLFYR